MKRILIVEDVEFNQDLLVQLLEEEYEILTAMDGAAGLELAAGAYPDLILMDLSLPTIDGWEVDPSPQGDPGVAPHPNYCSDSPCHAG